MKSGSPIKNKKPAAKNKVKIGENDVEEADILICRNLADEAKENWNKIVDLRKKI